MSTSGIIQPSVIDVANWRADELYFNYPEGARSKTAYFRPEQLEIDFIKKKRRYLFKRSDKRYPEQFWGEIVAYHVGCLLGVEVPPAYAAINSNEGDCAALIEWFYEDEKALFQAGGVFVQHLIPGFDRKRGLQHNFETVREIGFRLTRANLLDKPWLISWAEVFLFDALIGNTDRHQDNWGCMFTPRGKGAFAPLFDNGTSMGHERWPDRLKSWNEQRFEKYISDGRHHIRWKITDAEACGHIAVLHQIREEFPHLIDNLRERMLKFDMDVLIATINHLTTLDLPIALTEDRKDLYIKLITLRKRSIERALQ